MFPLRQGSFGKTRITSYNVCYTKLLRGEDRIAKKARLEQIEPMEVVQRYTVDFHNILNKFNFLPPSIEPTATGHIIEQIEIIKAIIDKGLAYEINGSVYFDVLKYNQTKEYGILSKRNVEDLIVITSYSIHYTKLYDIFLEMKV